MESELRLQQSCFVYFHNNFPDHRGRLYHNHQNAKNAMQGAQLKGAGLISGVADFTLIGITITFIEMKTDSGRQSEAQKKFQVLVESYGHKYYICRSLDEFKKIIHENL